jgi:hypothetical protein
MTRLGAVLDELATLEPAALGDAELADAVVTVEREMARLGALQARLAADLDARRVWAEDGSKSCAAWLARRCRGPRSQAARTVRAGRALRTMTATAEAFGEGAVSRHHVEELLACRRVAPAAFDDHEAALVEHARTMHWDDFVRVTAYWRQVHDPDGAERSAEDQYSARFLHLNQRTDGSWDLLGQLDAVDGAAVAEAIRRREQQLFERDWAEAKERRNGDVRFADLRRTGGQRRADALVELAHDAGAAPTGARRPRPLVSVFVDYETAAGRLCELSNGTVITPGQLLRIITRADVERVVFGPDSRVIDLGEQARFFTGATRRAVQLRDRRCTWPGCDAPAEQCDVDHLERHADGGPTTQDNGGGKCGYHHRLRHRGVDPPPGQPPDDRVGREVRMVQQRLRALRRERARPRAAGRTIRGDVPVSTRVDSGRSPFAMRG